MAKKKQPNTRETDAPAVAVTADGSVVAPIRRFLARGFDYVLYMQLLLWAMALSGMYMGSISATLVPMILAAFIMFCLEPLLLSRLGTTPGKALMGLAVEKPKGGRLNYSEGISRMDGVYHRGLGWCVPIWSMVRLWKSWSHADEGKLQPWDKLAPVRQKRRFPLSAVLFAVGCVLLATVDVVVMQHSELPGNKGDLTVEEFAENFNRQTSAWHISFNQRLNDEGVWENRKGSDPERQELPFQYTVEDGIVKAVTFSDSRVGREEPYLEMSGSQVLVALTSFVWAQKDAPLWGNERIGFLQDVLRRGVSDYTLEQAGVIVRCETQLQGFTSVDGALQPVEGAERYAAAYTFTMELKD